MRSLYVAYDGTSKIKKYIICWMAVVSKASTPRGNPCVLASVVSVQYREGDPKGWSTVLVTALGIWEKTVSRGHTI
jgi:hypothetical protein